jgi:RNA polymerase sigma-70 factor (ECF subfamily)
MAERDDDKSRDGMGATPLQNEDSMFARSVESIDVLTRRAQDGDSQAFEAVYRQTSDRVYALCLRMSGDADRAAELVQDVFVRVWERSASFRGDALFTTWLHRLTVNVVLQDRQRGAAARRAKSARRVLVLQDVQGYKYNEIAQMTGVSLGTVKAQIHRARGLVKEALA